MKNILVPTEFSNNAFHALRYVTTLFESEVCTFFLLNIYGGGKGFKGKSIANKTQEFSDDLKAASIAGLNKALRKINTENENSKHSYQLISKPGDLVLAVHSLLDELKIDLIVLGNKGEKSSIPVFLGSNTTGTLQSVKKCPILTVPKGAEITIPGEIGFATDFKKRFDTRALDSLRKVARLTGAAIRIVHIDEEEKLNAFQKTNLDSLLAYLEPLSYSVQRIPNFVSKAKIMQVFLENSDLDMFFMVNNEHSIMEKMLREPVVEKMIVKIDIPFFVIPEISLQP
jgi:nucleotide-binding universal stress UspA family protein